VLALARVEGLRLLRHPLVLLATVLMVWSWLAELRHRADPYPTLHSADIGTQVALLILAAAVLVAANLAALRAHRHGIEAHYGTLPLPAWRRTLAHLLSLVPVALLGALLAVVRCALLAAVPGAIGRPNPLELATGPVLVVLAGGLGILLARLVRSALVPPLALLVLAVALYFGLWNPLISEGGSGPHQWLGPLVIQTWAWPDVVPAELLGRPAGLHLAYLAGVVLLVAVAALVRAGGPRRPLAAAGAAALALAVAAGALQLRPPPPELVARRVVAMERPSSVQTCQRRGTVTYCLFPEFAPMAEGWDRTVRAVLRGIPPGAAPALVVRQQIRPLDKEFMNQGALERIQRARLEDNRRAGTPDPIELTTVWAVGGTLDLPLDVAYRAVGSPAVAADPAPEGRLACGAPAVVALWLAGRSSKAVGSDMRLTLGGFVGDLTTSSSPPGGDEGSTFNLALAGGEDSINLGAYETALALALLDRPAEQVGQALRRHWRELTSPATSSARAAALLGIRPPGDAHGRVRPLDCR